MNHALECFFFPVENRGRPVWLVLIQFFALQWCTSGQFLLLNKKCWLYNYEGKVKKQLNLWIFKIKKKKKAIAFLHKNNKLDYDSKST